LEINRQLPAGRKIRVISISVGWEPSDDGYDEIMAACKEAKAAGMLVICSSIDDVHGFSFDGLGRHPLASPNLFESYGPGLFGAKVWAMDFDDAPWRDFNCLLVPMDSRTTACPRGSDQYVFYRQGGWSWSIPYIAGVYALAAQVEPEITPERFWKRALKTGRTIELEHKGKRRSFGPIIDPVKLIGSISDDGAASQQAPSKNTIVPGVRIGDYALDMSKDEVLKKLGEPKAIHFGGERYTPNDLPRRYFMSFDDMSFEIDDGSVRGITVRSPLYRFPNGLGVGDSEERIRQAFGDTFQLDEYEGKDLLNYEDKGVQFEIHKTDRSVIEIDVYQPEGDRRDRDAPDSGKVTVSSEESPGPIMFPKIDRKPKPEGWYRGEMTSLPKYDPDSTDPFQIDLRSRDLARLDLSDSIDDLLYATFDDRTVWPASDRMPENFTSEEFMELGKNPGLGVRNLHKRGITGRGVAVAILDQPLLVDHQEYAERVRLYEEIHIQKGEGPAMHGAAVASIVVGKTVGVAPEAELYYIAQWNFDWEKGNTPTLRYLAQGIHRILEVNKQLPKDKKIRVISISKGWTRSHKEYALITEAVQEARAAGMLVVCSCVDLVHDGFDFGGLGRSPSADPDVFESYEAGLFLARAFGDKVFSFPEGNIWVPMDSRTTASPTGSDEYVFYRIGGFSWAIPYIAGVYALAVQADPAITPERFWALAAQTGRTIEVKRSAKRKPLGPIIDPVALITALQNK
jgi:hypothetical protein